MAKARDIIEGMQVLMELSGSEAHIGGADHDIIFGPRDENMTDELRKRLKKAGWHKSKEFDCWCCFV